MRMPRIRFTVRGIMVVVALVAVGIGGVIWGMRLEPLAQRYRDLAKSHAEDERSSSEMAEQMEKLARNSDRELHKLETLANTSENAEIRLSYRGAIRSARDSLWREKHFADVAKRRAIYHGILRGKYARAARYPWLPVAADLPVPR
jgi:hypothetical protein